MEPGEQIGRYVVEELLGEGGMGQVYRAYDATLNRRVAIKLLRSDRAETADTMRASGEEAVPSAARVVREARMAAALDHPNVVSIFDVGEQRGTPFIVMELVNGRSLRACVGRAEIPMTERIHWLLGIARALAAAHHVGLVHRDVKPENVLVRDDGVVKVLDFGIARLQPRHSQRPPAFGEGVIAVASGAAESTLAGTPAYMAPEQIRSQSLDARVDQFAWAVVAYELLTGTLPWTLGDARSASILMAVLERQPPKLSPGALGVAESFIDAVHRALEKDRDARFASMDALLLATGLAFSNGDIPMPGPVPSSRVDSSAQKVQSELSSAPTLLATNSAGALASAAAAAVGHRERRRKAYVRGGASLLVVAGLAAAREWRGTKSDASVQRTEAPAAAVVFKPHDARRLTFDPGCEEYPSFAPDGRTVVFDSNVDDDIQIVALDTATGVHHPITQGAGSRFAPAVSPDGKSIAYLLQNGDDVATWIVPFDGSSPPRRLVVGRLRPSWSPDGRAVWAGAVDRPARLDIETGNATRALEPPAGFNVLRTRELADGRVVARLLDRPTTRGRGLVLYPKDSDTSSSLFPDATEDSIGVSRDGLRLFVPKLLLPTTRVELWQVPLGGGPASLIPGSLILPTKGLDFAADGSKVVWSTCTTEQDIARLDSGGSEPSPAARKAGRAETMQATPVFGKTEWTDDQPVGIGTSKMVVVSDRAERRQLWVVDLVGKDAARRLPLGPLEAAAPAVSPDQAWIAFAAVGSGIYLVAVDGKSAVRRITTGSEDGSPTFAADGRSVFFHTLGEGHARSIARVSVDGATPPEMLIPDGERPAASPVNDTVAFLAGQGEMQRPMLYDVQARTSRPLSAALPKGVYLGPKFSTDGTHVAQGVGLNEILEVEVASGNVVRKFSSPAQVTSLTYVGPSIVISRDAWLGDLWMALDPWGPK